MQELIRKALARLGDSKEEIITNLGAMGIFGTPCIAHDCPLSRYLSSQIVELKNYKVHVGNKVVRVVDKECFVLHNPFLAFDEFERPIASISLTTAQKHFVRTFDDFEIPELIDQEIDIPGFRKKFNANCNCQRSHGLEDKEANQENSQKNGSPC